MSNVKRLIDRGFSAFGSTTEDFNPPKKGKLLNSIRFDGDNEIPEGAEVEVVNEGAFFVMGQQRSNDGETILFRWPGFTRNMEADDDLFIVRKENIEIQN